MQAKQMLETHPKGAVSDTLLLCIEACYDCAQVCTSCADACLAEDMVAEMRDCIRRNLDCADVCTSTGAIVTRQTGGKSQVVIAALKACEVACAACAEECGQHAGNHKHCDTCAKACRACEKACQAAAKSLA